MIKKTVIPGAMVEETAVRDYNVRVPAPEFVRHTAASTSPDEVNNDPDEQQA